MVYLNNQLSITNQLHNITININTYDALLHCQNIYHLQQANKLVTDDNLPVPPVLLVNASSKWSTTQLQQSILQSANSSNINVDDIGIVQLPYDWTYTTDYMGTYNQSLHITSDEINIKLLQQRDPILWFTALTLYDDELHDNGISTLNVKCRVMSTCFLVLITYFLRVDHVVVRIYETRIFNEFNTDHIIRDHTRYECSWEDLVKYKLPQNAALLNEPQLITRKLPPQFNIRHSIQLSTDK